MRYTFFLAIAAISLLLAFQHRDPFMVYGKVTDGKGQGIAHAAVFIKGSTKGTTTDDAGAFSIEVPREGALLVVSSVGYQTQEIKAEKGKRLSVFLLPSMHALQEVVVSGQETHRKKDITGAASAIRIRGVQTQQPANGYLQGKAAGVQVTGMSGTPGSSRSVRLRNPDQLLGSRGYESEREPDLDREGYDPIQENRFLRTADQATSTFSIDVDAASYSNIRRMIGQGQLPPAGAVRVEEMINYFHYNYPQPIGEDPMAVHTELAVCPWNPDHRLALIGLQGKTIPTHHLPPSNLVFLIDVSGSMQDPQKLPLVKASMKMLTDQLRPQDRVAMVVYAGAAGLVLPSTPGSESMRIKGAIDQLEAGGSTAGGAGIQLAYHVAREHFIPEGNNRVILCTDGDFNVGPSSDDAMVRLVEKERASGVFLTVLGYGMGNYQDAKMQKLSNKGNGNHAYIDNLSEARKVLINEFGGTLFTIAKDVKIQVEFNPARVQGYRLIGYENRMLAREDFNNDRKDAGELGSGHTVTALYEIIPAGVNTSLLDSVDALKYTPAVKSRSSGAFADELMTIKLRYKQPQGLVSTLRVFPVKDSRKSWASASETFRFASAVAGFGMILRNSIYKGNADYASIRRMASSAIGNDPEGYRREFLGLIDDAATLAGMAKRKEE